MATSTMSFESRVKKLMRYRYPLLIGAVLNGLFVIGIPVSQPQASDDTVASRSRKDETAKNRPTVAKSASATAPVKTPTPTGETAGNEPAAESTSSPATASADPSPANGVAGVTSTDRPARDPAMEVRIPLPGDHPTTHGVNFAQSLSRFGHAASIMETWYRHAAKPDPFAGMVSDGEPLAEAADPQAEGVGQPAPQSRAADAAATTYAVSLTNQAVYKLPVAFVVNGRVYVLESGATVELHGNQPFAVSFDRGGEFGTEELQLENGAYRFQVTDTGWQLTVTPAPE